MDTLKWLYDKTWRAGMVMAVVFVALYIASFFIPETWKGDIKQALMLDWHFLPAPQKITGQAPIINYNPEDDKVTEAPLRTYMHSVNVPIGGVIVTRMTLYGYARNDFFEKDGSFQIEITRPNGDFVGASRAYTKSDVSRYGYSLWVTEMPHLFAKNEPCVILFRKNGNSYKLKDTIVMKMNVVCG